MAEEVLVVKYPGGMNERHDRLLISVGDNVFELTATSVRGIGGRPRGVRVRCVSGAFGATLGVLPEAANAVVIHGGFVRPEDERAPRDPGIQGR